MTRTMNLLTLGLALVAMACWLVMFGAGHDVWHDLGRPDVIARLSGQGATPFDMHAFVYAFYALFVVLTVHLLATGFAALRRH